MVTYGSYQFMVAACTLLKFVPPLCPNHLADTYCTPNLKSCKERWLSGPVRWIYMQTPHFPYGH